jgi:hypothetical protein
MGLRSSHKGKLFAVLEFDIPWVQVVCPSILYGISGSEDSGIGLYSPLQIAFKGQYFVTLGTSMEWRCISTPESTRSKERISSPINIHTWII